MNELRNIPNCKDVIKKYNENKNKKIKTQIKSLTKKLNDPDCIDEEGVIFSSYISEKEVAKIVSRFFRDMGYRTKVRYQSRYDKYYIVLFVKEFKFLDYLGYYGMQVITILIVITILFLVFRGIII